MTTLGRRLVQGIIEKQRASTDCVVRACVLDCTCVEASVSAALGLLMLLPSILERRELTEVVALVYDL